MSPTGVQWDEVKGPQANTVRIIDKPAEIGEVVYRLQATQKEKIHWIRQVVPEQLSINNIFRQQVRMIIALSKFGSSSYIADGVPHIREGTDCQRR